MAREPTINYIFMHFVLGVQLIQLCIMYKVVKLGLQTNIASNLR